MPSDKDAASKMGKQLAVAVVLLLFSVDARAGPPRPDHPSPYCVTESCASSQHNTTGNIAEYVKTLVRPVAISKIGISVRDGGTKLIDGHEVSGAEVIDVDAGSPAASAGIRSARIAVYITFVSVIYLHQNLHQSSVFDNSDLIFAADGERVKNTLDLADRVEGLAPGDRLYLTVARRGRRVQSCIAITSP